MDRIGQFARFVDDPVGRRRDLLDATTLVVATTNRDERDARRTGGGGIDRAVPHEQRRTDRSLPDGGLDEPGIGLRDPGVVRADQTIDQVIGKMKTSHPMYAEFEALGEADDLSPTV